MTKSVDELMRLYGDAATAFAEMVHAGTAEKQNAHDAAWRALRSALEEVVANDRRYRWLRNEAWGGHVAGRRFPHVVEFKAGLRPGAITELAEEALDAAVDAAMQQAPEQEG